MAYKEVMGSERRLFLLIANGTLYMYSVFWFFLDSFMMNSSQMPIFGRDAGIALLADVTNQIITEKNYYVNGNPI